MKNIFLVEDHHVVRYGIKSLLETNEQYRIVGEADNAEHFLEHLTDQGIDLLISDISLPGMNGIELTKQVKKRSGGRIKVLILSMHADELYINKCFEAGADGYLLKDFSKNEIFGAIDSIIKGEIYTSRSVSQILARNFINKEYSNKNTVGRKIEITKREKEIIELISLGHSNKEIADKLNLSISTVDAHRYNILKKLEVKNTAEMIMKAIKLKIINLS